MKALLRAVNRWDRLQPHALSGGSVNRILKALGGTCGLDFVPTLKQSQLPARLHPPLPPRGEKVDFAQTSAGGWKHDGTVCHRVKGSNLRTTPALY